MTEWISPIDGHRHYGEAARAECAVCRLKDERDVFRDQALPEAVTVMNGLSAALIETEAERDRLRARLLELEAQVGEREQHLRDALKDMRTERDRLRAVVEAARAYLDEVPTSLRDDVSAAEDNRLGDLIAALDRSTDIGGDDHAEETCVDSACPLHPTITPEEMGNPG